DNGTRLLIPPASRFAIAVTIPAEGELVLEMPERGGGAKTINAPGVLYTNNGTDNPPAVIGSLSVLPSAISYADGFFVFPTQVIEDFDPTTGLRTGPDKFAIDNANAPAPTMHMDESVIQPGILAIRTRFDEFTGLYVMHCHRLNHEDNGLMGLINVIPAVSIY